MDFKPIELQHALPKTQDIGKMQNQMHQRSNIEQSLLMTQARQLEIEKRKKTEKLSKSQLYEQNTSKSPKGNMNKTKEPTKGRFIDLEL